RDEERGGQAARQQKTRQVTSQRRVVGDQVPDEQPAPEAAGDDSHGDHRDERDQGKLLQGGQGGARAPAHQANPSVAESSRTSALIDSPQAPARYLCISDKDSRPPHVPSLSDGPTRRRDSARRRPGHERAPRSDRRSRSPAAAATAAPTVRSPAR